MWFLLLEVRFSGSFLFLLGVSIAPLAKLKIFSAARLNYMIDLRDALAILNTHMPWWKWKTLTLGLDDCPDLITVNHAICEMHPYAVSHLLSFAANSGTPPFLMWGTGAQGVINNMDAVTLKRICL